MPLIKAISRAAQTVEIVIFRCDQGEVERALGNAARRGVDVRALIANTNRSGEESLRKLEMRLLETGVIVARTADGLARYHGKLMIVDRRELHLLAFNLTHTDIERSRSFGVITRNRSLVREAVKLFEADRQRQIYKPGLDRLVVSPANARQQLSAFLSRAKKELCIYDPVVSDPAMVRLLQDRAAAGVTISIIGRWAGRRPGVAARKLSPMRLHTRTIIRDGSWAFIGSQSLRTAELDGRREVGIIFRDSRLVRRLARIFQSDWDLSGQSADQAEQESAPAAKVAKRVAKTVVKELPPVAPVVDGAVKDLVGEAALPEVIPADVEEIVKDAVKDAVRAAVQNVMEGAVEDHRAESDSKA
jgi:phosphatidylserine/phosphatidylglycerophosphate/cardiolipin synthase-like enzyme